MTAELDNYCSSGYTNSVSPARTTDSNADRWDVFVSYSRLDASIASRLVADFLAAGLTVWHDAFAISAAGRVRERINEGIAGSSAFVIVVSRRSLRSAWVLNELDSAMLREIAESRDIVMPVLVGRVDPSELPPDIQGKRFVDLRHNFNKQYEVYRRFLLASIKSAVYPSPARPGDVTLKVGIELLDYVLTTYARGGNRGQLVGSLVAAEQEMNVLAENMAADMQEKPVDQLGADGVGVVYILETYGILALKRLLLFYFVRYRLDPENYTIEQVFEMVQDALATATLFWIDSVLTEYGRSAYVRFPADSAPTVWDGDPPA